ncbi:MAG: hypothetical protein M0R50_08085 [Candidatus Cloacimonetes bacterium]|jgi:hypothetical protein|nr:hypothetical protein [Candidatus Cloacimonadota bacterium]
MKLSSLQNDNDIIKTPYSERRGYKIYLVDGGSVRNLSSSAEEFGGVAIHPQFPDLIPEDEVWIEKDSHKNEIPLLVDTALYQLEQIAAGKNKDEVYDAAINREKRERGILDIIEHGKKVNAKLPRSIYVEPYCVLKDGSHVWLVNGEEVRNHTKTDFIEGGHGYVYDFIPKGEIWLEDGISEEELPYILYHETTERTLMKNSGMSYDKAHEISADKEYKARQKDEM